MYGVIRFFRSLALTLLRREAWFERTIPGKFRVIHRKGGVLLGCGAAVTALFGLLFGVSYQSHPDIAELFKMMAGISFIMTLLCVWWHTD